MLTNTVQIIWERFAVRSSWAQTLHKDKECDIFSLPVLSDKQWKVGTEAIGRVEYFLSQTQTELPSETQNALKLF